MQLCSNCWVGTVGADKVRKFDNVLVYLLVGATFHIRGPNESSSGTFFSLWFNALELHVDQDVSAENKCNFQ